MSLNTGSLSTASLSTASTASIRLRIRRNRGLIAIGLIFVIMAGGAVLLRDKGEGGELNPLNFQPIGARAIATVLAEQGVTVTPTKSLAATIESLDESAAVLITRPDLVSSAMVRQLLQNEPSRVILVEATPANPLLARLAAGVEVADAGVGRASDDPRIPGCDDPLAQRAGTIRAPGLIYDARRWVGPGPSQTTACYSTPASATWVDLPASGQRPAITLLGSGSLLTNEHVAEAGNAAFALGLLGRQAHLVWWNPSPADPALSADAKPIADLVPPWAILLVVQAFVAVLFLAAWRIRRLGAVVVEPLPVVVRASETAEGRGRLLHRAQAHDIAAAQLRARCVRLLAARTGVPEADQTALTAAVAGRTGTPTDQVRDWLFGPVPSDDTALVELHDGLRTLEEAMR